MQIFRNSLSTLSNETKSKIDRGFYLLLLDNHMFQTIGRGVYGLYSKGFAINV